MPIENRNLEPGTVLTARYKKQERTCEVVQTDEGLRYRLDDGTEHKSPSSAGKAAMDGVACNGWRFWSLAGTERPAKTKAAAKPKKEPAAKKPAKAKAPAKAKKGAKTAKKPTGKAMRVKATDVASYGCGGCGATFGSQKAAVAHAMTHTD
jgi:hypothetical protein